jgi:hypothetical protein
MKKRFFKVLFVLAVCTAAAVFFSCSKKAASPATDTGAKTESPATDTEAKAATTPVLTVTNNTGFTAYYLYISESSTEEWEEDVLDDDVIMNGDSVAVTLPSAGTWDVMIEDEDEDTYTKYNIKVTKDTAIEITIGDLD